MSAWVRSAVAVALVLITFHYIDRFGLLGPLTRAMYVLMALIAVAAIVTVSVVVARRYVIPLRKRYRRRTHIRPDGPIIDYRRPQ